MEQTSTSSSTAVRKSNDVIRKSGKQGEMAQTFTSSLTAVRESNDETTNQIKPDSTGLGKPEPPQTESAEKFVKTSKTIQETNRRTYNAKGDGPQNSTAPNTMPPLNNKPLLMQQRQLSERILNGDHLSKDSSPQDVSLDDLPPLSEVPLRRKKKWGPSFRNTGAMTSGYGSETHFESTDTTDTEYQPEKRERLKYKLKTTPQNRHRKHSGKTPPTLSRKFDYGDEMTTDHEVESSSTLSDHSIVSSSSLLSDDSTIPAASVHSDDSLTPTRFSLTAKKSSNESTPTSQKYRNSRRSSKRSSKASPHQRTSKTPLMPQLVSPTHQPSAELPSMPPLSSASERSSPVSMKSENILKDSNHSGNHEIRSAKCSSLSKSKPTNDALKRGNLEPASEFDCI